MDNLIFKGNSLVVPKTLRNEMLNRIHYSHLGINKCIKLAEESLFWPGMKNQIKQKISNCHVCLTYSNSQNREVLKPHDIPDIPWAKVGCDIFEIQGYKYLLVIDYFSKYVEIEHLNKNTSSLAVINSLKSIFARHGIPLTVISDGGPQFTSYQFKTFAKDWDFMHIMSSPTYAQSNGMAERHIQTVKKMFKKVCEEKKEINLALLYFRSTPIYENISPAEILMSRKLRTTLPVTTNKLRPNVSNMYNKKITKHRQDVQKKYYNKKSTVLVDIQENSPVYVQIKPFSNWLPGVVIKKIRDRTYIVQMKNGSILTRNRRFIKPLRNNQLSDNHSSLVENPNSLEKGKKEYENKCYLELESESENDNESDEDASSSAIDLESDSSSDEFVAENNNPIVTSSGRHVKAPQRLNL